jgi:hypothetical protein
MANISLTLYTNGFFGSVLMSPIQMGSLSVNNSVTNFSRLGTFKGDVVMQLHTGAEHFGNVIFRYSQLTSQYHIDASIDVNHT